VVLAVALMALFAGAYYYPYDPGTSLANAIEFYLRLQARAAGAVIALFDPSVTVRGTLINGRFPVQVVKSCSSLDAQALYAAAVLAFPARVLDKTLGLLLGVGLLSSLNLTRIAGLSLVGAHRPEWFDTIHEEILPLLLVISSCLAFVAWVRWTRRENLPAAL